MDIKIPNVVLAAALGAGPLFAQAGPGSGVLPPLAPQADAACQPAWVPTFGSDPSFFDEIEAFVVFDDGGGPALYAAGRVFFGFGQQRTNVAKWNGMSWAALGGELTYGEACALAVFDDGSGPALYAGGSFSEAGGVAASSIAKWNGSSWTPLGDGITGEFGAGAQVRALAVFDDGSGPALYAGGWFSYAGGLPARSIAKWDGASWSPLGSGMIDGWGLPAPVDALTVFDDGSGPALCAGGVFPTAGGVPVSNIARWDGSDWSPVGSWAGGWVSTLAVFDDGSGEALYAGGGGVAGGVPATGIGRWDGSIWSPVGGGTDGSVSTLTVFDDGSGEALYAGGSFTGAGGAPAGDVARWDGTSWSAMGDGVGDAICLCSSIPIRALAAFDDGRGQVLHAGGYFTLEGEVDQWGTPVPHAIATWNGSQWSTLSGGIGGPSSNPPGVYGLAVHDDGSGPALYAGGVMSVAGGVPVNNVAKWNGMDWAALGGGTNGGISALATFDAGGGPALYAGGSFSVAGGVGANCVASWDGAGWSPVGGGVDGGAVQALGTFDDGSGPALYAGGSFTVAGGVSANGVARWDGTNWTPLGGGVQIPFDTATVQAFAVFDDGSSPALYAGGHFVTAGGAPANHIAKWDGSVWSALGGGTDHYVSALAVFDDGGGPALYAGGGFGVAGGVAAHGVARWDGSTWSPVGGGTDGGVFTLAVFDDGSGAALYAGGWFESAGGVPASSIARWGGSSWSALGSGIASDGGLLDLAVFDDGNGPSLFAGGQFSSAPDSGDGHLARWAGCPVLASPWTDVGSGLAGLSGVPQLVGDGSLEPDSSGSIALTDAAPLAPALLFGSLTSTPTPFKGGTLVPVPFVLTLLVETDGAGELLLGWTAWPPGLSALTLYFQFGVQDVAAVKGVALSNALRADVP